MELLDGESLEQAIARGNLDVSAVLCIGIEMADALDAAHTDAICRWTAGAADFLISEGRALHNLLAVASRRRQFSLSG
jgi:hypothetical protein